MSVESNKAIVRRFFELTNALKVDEAFALTTDDSTWWLSGSLPNSGTSGKAKQIEAVRASVAAFDGPLEVNVLGMVAEGDKVAVEMEAHATLKNGVGYHQVYHQVFEFRDGLICAMRSYIDTDHARKIMESVQ